MSLAIVALVMLYSCQENDELETLNQTNSSTELTTFNFEVTSQDVTGVFSRNTETACSSTNLIAGQNEVAGRIDVEIVNEESIDYVYITYITNSDWILKLTHLYAGDRDGIPETRNGNPKPGVFEKRMDYSANVISDFEIEYKIEADAFTDCFYIAAHAEVYKASTSQNETAWGEGEGFDGNSWAMYYEFCKSYCNESGGGDDNGEVK